MMLDCVTVRTSNSDCSQTMLDCVTVRTSNSDCSQTNSIYKCCMDTSTLVLHVKCTNWESTYVFLLFVLREMIKQSQHQNQHFALPFFTVEDFQLSLIETRSF